MTIALKKSIETSVLCWLATVDKEGIPNVSPKEIFTQYKEDYIIVANIASPQTVLNIKQQPIVCISFINIFIQKGYQVKGEAKIIKKSNSEFDHMAQSLLKITGGKFPFSTITQIRIQQVKEIIAPKYILYPETTEEEQIESAKHSYQLK